MKRKGILKRFLIWLGWFGYKYPLAAEFVFYGGMFFFVISGFTLFIYFGLLEPGIRFTVPPSQSILIAVVLVGILGLLIIVLTALCRVFSDSRENFRIAIYEAEKFFLADYPKCAAKVKVLTEGTKRLMDGTKLNNWTSNWQKLSCRKKELGELKEELESLPKQIRERTEEIKALEFELSQS